MAKQRTRLSRRRGDRVLGGVSRYRSSRGFHSPSESARKRHELPTRVLKTTYTAVRERLVIALVQFLAAK